MQKLRVAVVAGLVAAATAGLGHLTMQAQPQPRHNTDDGLMTPQQLKQFAAKVRQTRTHKEANELLLRALGTTPTQRKQINIIEARAERRVAILRQPLRASKKPLSKQQMAKLASQVRDSQLQFTKEVLAVLTPAQRARFNQIMFAGSPKHLRPKP